MVQFSSHPRSSGRATRPNHHLLQPYHSGQTISTLVFTPSGSWYFIKHPPEPAQDAAVNLFSRSYRTYPNNQTMTPLLVAIGCAASRMPALKHMSVVAPEALPPMIITFGLQRAIFYFDFYKDSKRVRHLKSRAMSKDREWFSLLAKSGGQR